MEEINGGGVEERKGFDRLMDEALPKERTTAVGSGSSML
jgi:hypothetical protein